jgi:predicted outer membrane repeat protein
VAGELKVPKGTTLTILPGTKVLFQEGARILVNGRLWAEGTAADPLLFTRATDKSYWRGLQFDQTVEDNRICHARLEYARTDDGMVGLQKSRLLLEDVEFDHCDRRRIRTLSSSLIVRRCRFADMFGPDEPPTTNNMSENLWGSGIPDGGWLIIEDNVFGRNKGHNDAIDFDGPAAPKPIPHIRNNLFLGGGDDAMDLECDALIEGNTFMSFVKDQYNKASGESNVLSAGAGKHYTMAHNIVLNSQHVVQVKNEASLTFTNNTVVNVSGAAIYFELGLPGRRPGHGGDIANCIFWNTPDVFEGITEKTDFAVDYSLLPVKWHSFGTGNIWADPLFARPGYWDPNGTPNGPKDDFWVEGDYHLKSQAGRWDPALRQWVSDKVTSPCIDAGNDSPDWKNEPWPHGRRINMGAYGGTPEASMSLSGLGSPADFSGDGRVDLRDYSILAGGWLSVAAPRTEDLNRNTTVDSADLAAFSSWWLWPTH